MSRQFSSVGAVLKTLSVALLLAAVLVLRAEAALEFSGYPVFWFPNRELDRLGYEAMGVGVCSRLAVRFKDNGNLHPYLFGEASYLTYGSKDGFVPIEKSPYLDDGLSYHSLYELYLACSGVGLEYDADMVRPYLEAFGGYSYYQSSVLFHHRRAVDPLFKERHLYKGHTFNLGLGLGLRITIWRTKDEEPGREKSLLWDFKLSYVGGGQTEVYYREPVLLENDAVVFRTTTPPVTHFQFRVGLLLVN